MNWKIHKSDTVFEVTLSDRLGFEDHVHFRNVLDKFIASSCKDIKFILNNLNDIDSSGLGMFLLAKDMSEDQGRSLVLSQPQGKVKALFELTDFYSTFEILP